MTLISMIALSWSMFFTGFLTLEFFKTRGGMLVIRACLVASSKLLISFYMAFIFIIIFCSMGFVMFGHNPLTHFDRKGAWRYVTFWQDLIDSMQYGLQGDLARIYGDIHGNIEVLISCDNCGHAWPHFCCVFACRECRFIRQRDPSWTICGTITI